MNQLLEHFPWGKPIGERRRDSSSVSAKTEVAHFLARAGRIAPPPSRR